MIIYGAATLGNGDRYSLDGNRADNETSRGSISINDFLYRAFMNDIDDIIGNSALSEDECQWAVTYSDGTNVSLSDFQSVHDMITKHGVDPTFIT